MKNPLLAGIKRAWDLLFGFDYFISHRWEDGHDYAKELCAELEKRELDCFLDERNYETGGNLRLMQKLALGRTTRLIVIVSPLAHQAAEADRIDWLLEEVREFKRNRTGAAISVIGTLESLSPAAFPESLLVAELPSPAVQDLFIVDEATQSRGKPRPETVAKLVTDFTELSRRTLRMRIMMATAFVMTLLAALAAWQWIEARNQSQRRQELLVDASRREYQNGVSLMGGNRIRDGMVNLGLALRYDSANSAAATLLQTTVASMHRDPAPESAMDLKGTVKNARASADGNHLVACLEGGSVVGFSAGDGKLTQTFRFQKSMIPEPAVWSPDSAWFALDTPGGVEIRRAGNGLAEANILPADRSGGPQVSSLAFQPDSKVLAVAWNNGLIQTWEHFQDTWQQQKSASLPLTHLRLAWANGKLLVGGAAPGGGKLLTLGASSLVETGDALTVSSPPQWLEADAAGNAALFIDEEGAGRFWRIGDGSKVANQVLFQSNPGVSCALRLSPDGRHWAFANHLQFFLLRTKDGTPVQAGGYKVGSGINSLHFSPDARRLFVSTEAGQGAVFDLEDGSYDRICQTAESPVVASFWSGHLKRIVTVSRNGGVGFWGGGMLSAAPMTLSDEQGEAEGIVALRFDDAGTLWSLRRSGKLEKRPPGTWTKSDAGAADDRFAQGHFLDGGGHIGVITERNQLQVREVPSLRVVSGTVALASGVSSFDASVAADRIVVATLDRALNAYRIDGTFVWGIPEALPGSLVRQVTIIPAKRWAVVTANNLLNKPGGTRILNIDSGKLVGSDLIGEGQHESHAWLAASGQVLTTEKGSQNQGWVRLWNPEEGKETGRFQVPSTVGTTPRAWPRSEVIQVPGFSGSQFYSIKGHFPVAFSQAGGFERNDLSADGRLLAAGNDEGRLQLWELYLTPSSLPKELALDLAVAGFSGSKLDENRTIRNLPLRERAQFLQQARQELEKEEPGLFRNLLLWKFNQQSDAPLSPAFTRTRRQEIDRLIDVGTKNSTEYAYRIDPSHPLVHLALAAHMEAPLADFYRNFGLQRLPDDANVWLRAAELLLVQGRREDARNCMAKAEALAGSQDPSSTFKRSLEKVKAALEAPGN